MIAGQLRISISAVRTILHDDLKVKNVCTKIVPRILTLEGEFMEKSQMTVLYNPPYLRDLAPCDILLFLGVKYIMRGEHLGDNERFKREMTKTLKTVKLSDYEHCFSECQQRWQRCIHAKVHYIEGDNVNFVCIP